jgi:2-polyprenyl-6-methoxyphenol hydroxylase-like FAD-dependent oxidoreductase
MCYVGAASVPDHRSDKAKGSALVIGGSLGGLFTVNLLRQAGWDVDIYERVGEPLHARGAGIATHPRLLARTILAEQRECFAAGHMKRDIFERQGSAESLGDTFQGDDRSRFGRVVRVGYFARQRSRNDSTCVHSGLPR